MSATACQLCGKPLSRIRLLRDGDFCCREHREQFQLRRGMTRVQEASDLDLLARLRERPAVMPVEPGAYGCSAAARRVADGPALGHSAHECFTPALNPLSTLRLAPAPLDARGLYGSAVDATRVARRPALNQARTAQRLSVRRAPAARRSHGASTLPPGSSDFKAPLGASRAQAARRITFDQPLRGELPPAAVAAAAIRLAGGAAWQGRRAASGAAAVTSGSTLHGAPAGRRRSASGIAFEIRQPQAGALPPLPARRPALAVSVAPARGAAPPPVEAARSARRSTDRQVQPNRRMKIGMGPLERRDPNIAAAGRPESSPHVFDIAPPQAVTEPRAHRVAPSRVFKPQSATLGRRVGPRGMDRAVAPQGYGRFIPMARGNSPAERGAASRRSLVQAKWPHVPPEIQGTRARQQNPRIASAGIAEASRVPAGAGARTPRRPSGAQPWPYTPPAAPVRSGPIAGAHSAMPAPSAYRVSLPVVRMASSVRAFAASFANRPALMRMVVFGVQGVAGGLIPDGNQGPVLRVEDNFATGLGRWAGTMDDWKIDAAGVRTGSLALFRPSLGMRDYDLEFLAKIEKRAVGWVVRARDFNNYCLVSVASADDGRAGAFELVRRAVIAGVRQEDVRVPLRAAIRSKASFRVSTSVNGAHYSVSVEGQQVAEWTDDRLPAGGIGFVADREGDTARLYWVTLCSQGLPAATASRHIAPAPEGPGLE